MSKELDIAVARALGFRVVKDAANVRGCQIGTAGRNGFDLPYYSDDARQVALLLKEIERRQLRADYMEQLEDVLKIDVYHGDHGFEGLSVDAEWALLCATPEQHCRAFIAVCTPAGKEAKE